MARSALDGASTDARIMAAIHDRKAPSATRVIVVGQGYVGLPIAMRAVDAGYQVVGLDVDSARTDRLAAANSYVRDVPNLTLLEALSSGRYLPSSEYSAAAGFDYAIITVPTPLRNSIPDLASVESAGHSLAPYITPGAVVILESTTYPGTTEEVLVPILEAGSSLRSGTDFAVGYSPERIDPGNAVWTFRNTPKVVAGIDRRCTEAIKNFYATLVDRVVEVSSTRTAELTKLLENSFRHVNIALVNELATHSQRLRIDIWEVIEAAATKPFGFMPFTPGPGVGGHCLPVDPSYLSWLVKGRTGHTFRFIELANDVNRQMPSYIVSRVVNILNRSRLSVAGSKLLLLGLAYKANTGDVRESPAVQIARELAALEGEVEAVDPFVEPSDCPRGVRLVKLTEGRARNADLIVVLTDHHDIDYQLVQQSGTQILDTRRCVAGPTVEHL